MMKTGGMEGFSLIELLVVLAIMAIISTLSIESMTGLVSKYKLDRASRDLLSKLKLAQISSITRNQPIVLFLDVDADTFDAYIDADNSGTFVEDPDEFFNLETGTVVSNAVVIETPGTVDITAATFGTTNPPFVSYVPPSGRPSTTFLPPGLTNGVVCFSQRVDNEMQYRRVTLRPVIGALALWRNSVDDTDPGCTGANDDDWEQIY